MRFNGIDWRIEHVEPGSPYLIDRSDIGRIATTDPVTHTIYLSNYIAENDYETVLFHELSHAVMVSYGLLDDIAMFSKPEMRIYAEEWICNYIATFSKVIADEMNADKDFEIFERILRKMFERK